MTRSARLASICASVLLVAAGTAGLAEEETPAAAPAVQESAAPQSAAGEPAASEPASPSTDSAAGNPAAAGLSGSEPMVAPVRRVQPKTPPLPSATTGKDAAKGEPKSKEPSAKSGTKAAASKATGSLKKQAEGGRHKAKQN